MTAVGKPPFEAALTLDVDADGYRAELGDLWTIGGRVHGGVMFALLTRAALLTVADTDPGLARDPLAVSVECLRAPDLGEVRLRSKVIKTGRTTTVAAVEMVQGGRVVVTGTVTAGRLPDGAPEYQVGSTQPVAPPPHAIDPAETRMAAVIKVARVCDIRLDPDSVGFVRKPPVPMPPELRVWTRPRDEDPDPLFAVVAGDIAPPTVMNMSFNGWAPTVQFTALVRARPVPGWLRVRTLTQLIAGGWFEQDATVHDSAGRLVAQARQLAMVGGSREMTWSAVAER